MTTKEIRDRREHKGIGLQDAKAEILHERLIAKIQAFDRTGDRKQLTEILFDLADRKGK
ncbi:hypothetical protein [Alterisphingorhabdus coralli]|uniref:Uncharacterized protein n=1 Tax=Alterisphingorhabdus coralli TaxID=3071408 RepID=A0AA97FC54_9SPHN|nr:hypothetical protein [Parasphingorhabdus sp. SCSIO 66989]WOE76345.1 hypothetical protein RB602_06430 [Parasphingorhabdus sp. SCSIO 66989]